MKYSLTLILIFGFSFCFTESFSQPSFTRLISTEYNDFPTDLVEYAPGKYLVLSISGDYWQPETNVSHICLLDETGDTSILQYSMQDTILQFHQIAILPDNEYLIFGACANQPEYDRDLIVLKLDSDFNVLSYKRFDIPGYNRISKMCYTASNGIYYLQVTARNTQNNFSHSVLYKINEQGDTLASKLLDTIGNGQYVGDIELSWEKDELWLFGSGFSIYCQGSRIVMDTSLNLIRSHCLPSTADENMNSLWYSDSTLLFAAEYWYSGSDPQDNDIGISITDTSFLDFEINYFGAIDTIDYPAWGNILDFQDVDSIFYAGTHNIIIAFWPEGPSWVMFGQLDNALNKRFEYYYGGDAFYQTMDIIATSDGGCLITALRYDHTTQDQENDIIVLKYNKEDLITRTPDYSIAEESDILLYPNPGHNKIFLHTDAPNAQVLLYDMKGKLVLFKTLKSPSGTISTKALISGTYICRIISGGRIISNTKWIKQ